jgi:hypothetical protein
VIPMAPTVRLKPTITRLRAPRWAPLEPHKFSPSHIESHNLVVRFSYSEIEQPNSSFRLGAI